ncbi:DNA repair protein RecO [[Clostridium] colinum]|uniref:DNA repair protein RecO n=1 Tax=[Clostridium] colinum TaxID=36835 RepID=UPI0020244B33|nr:DNA repair protein RecO [[Clostridium] colinum]
MSTFKARGIIIKENLVGDNDKSLIILLKDYGKFTIWARNCRNSKSKLLSGSSIFSYADFIIYDNGRTLSLNQIDIIENFYNLTEDLDSLAYGTYFLEFIDKNTQEATPINDIMLLLLKSLLILSKSTSISPKLICKIFEIKFLQLNGYMPLVDNCSYCNNIINKEDKIYWGSNGVVCKNCVNKEEFLLNISYNSILVTKYILSSKIDKLYNFNVSDNILNELSLISKKLLNSHLYVNLKSSLFIEELENI